MTAGPFYRSKGPPCVCMYVYVCYLREESGSARVSGPSSVLNEHVGNQMRSGRAWNMLRFAILAVEQHQQR